MSSFIKTFLVLTIVFMFSHDAFSQSIVGTVTDSYFSDPLPGAVAKIQGTNTGSETDLDGKYEITGLQPGTYTLEISYVGYQTKIITGVVVNAGELTRVDVALGEEAIVTDEVTVEATTSMANEEALLLERKNADEVSDAIGQQQMKRAPDDLASEVLKRVIGVSIVDNKFVYVRGTSERYSNTTLNGVEVPSTESETKSFSFDLFPSNLLENIIISKTYTPDKPANFSGGLVQVNTLDFPESFVFNLSTKASYNSKTTGDNFRDYDAGQDKFLFFNLGFDNGDRKMPGDIPGFRVNRTNLSDQELKNIARSFRNDWGQLESTAPPNSGFQLSVGNKMELADNPFGYFGAYTYGSSFQNEDVYRAEYQQDNNIEQEFSGINSVYSVQWGALANLSYKLGDNNKITFKNSYVVNTTDGTQFLDGYFEPQDVDQRLYLTQFKRRDVLSSTLSGEHYLHSLNRLNFTWRVSYSEADVNEPDRKTMTYQRERGTDNPYMARLTVTNNPLVNDGGRFFSTLNDYNRSFESNFEFPLNISKNINPKIKTGVFANGKRRNFNARLFAPYFTQATNVITRIGINSLPIDSIFMAQNFDTNKIYMGEFTRPSDNYNASEDNYAGFLMTDVPFGKFRVIIGARYEYDETILNTFTDAGAPLFQNIINRDILPSVNTIFALNEKTNIRASYFQSVSRPELRELAPFGYTDFNTNIFIFGNPDLRRTLIRNYDLRYEVFPNAGEIASISLFYKKIDAPIERVFVPGSGSDTKSLTYENAVKGATNFGAELELRKNLGFISKTLDFFTFNGNLTLIDSKVDISGLGSTATETERRLQGQSPYTVNIGVYYDNPITGTSVNLSYNRFGNRISEVGLAGFGDVEENGRNSLDMTISQKFLQRFTGKLSLSNILNEDKIYTQEVNGIERTVREYKEGSGVSLSVGYDF